MPYSPLHAVQPTNAALLHLQKPVLLKTWCPAYTTKPPPPPSPPPKQNLGGRRHTFVTTWHEHPSHPLHCAIGKLAIYHASCCCATQKPAACPGLPSKLMTADEVEQVCTENMWMSTTQISNRTRAKSRIESTASVYLNTALHSCAPRSSTKTRVARSQPPPKMVILIPFGQIYPQRRCAQKPHQPDKTVLLHST
jgi:hypothetical protein